MSDKADKPTEETKPDDAKSAESPQKTTNPDAPAPVTRQHTMNLSDRELSYGTTSGFLPLKDDKGEHTADIFFTAYTLDNQDVGTRPITFVFNGGPGSASVWLHLGGLAPYRVAMDGEDGWMPAPPYRLVPNEATWLDATDLVFIDPVGTGYSRATAEEHNEKFWNLKGDLDSMSEFIRLYLTRYERWASPVYLAGESYGTTRVAGLTEHLVNRGIACKGVMLISIILNFQTLRFDYGNDLPYALYLPTYTATAWYHGRLHPDLQSRPLRELLAEVETWVIDAYMPALARGTSLSAEARAQLIAQIARYTGISERFVRDANLRLEHIRYCKELLRDTGRTVGRLDSRYTGYDKDNAGEHVDFDPSMTAIVPPYTATMNDYARRVLGVETNNEYEVLSFKVFGGWKWHGGNYPDTSQALRSTMAKNPHMRVFMTLSYYDLATPYFAAQYTFNNLNLPQDLQANVSSADYEAGHMMYLHLPSLRKLQEDVLAFMAL